MNFADYLELAFNDVPRDQWVENYDEVHDLFENIFVVGNVNADYATIFEAIAAAPANSPTLIVVQSGTWAIGSGNLSASNKQVAITPESRIYGDVVINTNSQQYISGQNSLILFDQIVFTKSYNFGLSYPATSSKFRVLFSGCNLDSDPSEKVMWTWFSGGSDASTGLEISRFRFLACSCESSASSSTHGIDADYNPDEGFLQVEIRRTVYPRSATTIKSTGSTYTPVFDLEDLSLTESSTYGAASALSSVPTIPGTLGYLTDSLEANAAIKSVLISRLFESLVLDQIQLIETYYFLKEKFKLVDSLAKLASIFEVSDFTVTGDSNKRVEVILLESLLFSVFYTTVEQRSLSDGFSISGEFDVKRIMSKAISESVDFSETQYITYVQKIIETVLFSELTSETHKIMISIYESMGLGDSIEARGKFARSLTEAINFLDNLGSAAGVTIRENIALSSNDIKLTLAFILAETATFNSTITNKAIITAVISEGFVVDDTLTSKGIFQVLLSEKVVFTISIPDEEGDYLTYVMNTETGAVSEYTGYPFNSISGEYGATSTGIYKLTGDTDDGAEIEASIKTGLMDFNSNYLKSIPYCYLGCSTDGDMILKVSTTHRGKKVEVNYQLTQERLEADTVKLKLGKGVKARYWQFELAGGDFELDSLSPMIKLLSRRI